MTYDWTPIRNKQGLKIADLDTFNHILKKAKGKMKWKDVAKLCGMSESQLDFIRRGRRNPSHGTLMRLSYIVGRDGGSNLFNALYRCTEVQQNMEDYEIEKENAEYRKNGFKGTAIRSMYAAVCIQACIDFRKARSGCKTVDGRPADEVAKECHEFFGSSIFRTESGQSSVEYIEKCIMLTKPGDLQWLWRKNELFRKPPSPKTWLDRNRELKTGRFAKNTRPIIEGL